MYQAYETSEAVAFFGSDALAEQCNGQWIIFPTTIICLATLGAWPRASHFLTASRFRWVADAPYRVGTDPSYPPCLPNEVIAGNAKGRTLHLFVRGGKSQKYIYAGEMGSTHAMGFASKNNYGSADFTLLVALPSTVWTGLGGLHIGDTDHAAVDAALDRLRDGPTREVRFAVLKRLVEYWHGSILPSDGTTDAELAGIQMPTVLYDWYRWAGKRPEILSGQNIFFSPRDEQHKYWELAIEDGCLRFYVENQGVYEWATLANGDDPPVFGKYNHEESWHPEGITLSEHLILACLFEAVGCHSKYGAAAAWLEERVLNEIVRAVPPIAVGEWRWLDGARFYARRGAFMYACPNGTDAKGMSGFSVWIGAKTEHPLQFLRPYLDESWEFVAL